MTIKDLKDILISQNIIKIKTKNEELFTLKFGKKSRLFINIKEASLNPYILKEIIKILLEYSRYEGYSKIASVAIGGIPIATILSYETKIPQIIIRSEKHDRGMKSQIIGDCENENCVIIEDVATTGGSLVKAVKVIRDAGGICNDAIVIVDREEGAQQLCKENNIKLISCLKKSDFGIFEENE